MLSRVRNVVLLFVVVAPWLVCTKAFGQPSWASNSSNGRLYLLNWAPPGGTVTVVNTADDAQLRKSLAGMVADAGTVGQANLIVCDAGAGGELLVYENVVPPVPASLEGFHIATVPGCDGPSLDLEGNIYVGSSPGGSAPKELLKFNRVPCPPGSGRVACFEPDPGNPIVTLNEPIEQTLFVRSSAGSLAAGDLLVLTPSQVLLCQGATAPCDPFIRLSKQNQGAGIASFIDGGLWITTLQGRILWYNGAGSFVATAATGLGQGKFKIVIGIQDGQNTAIVSDRNGGEVHRLRIPSSNPDDFPITTEATITQGVQSPNGVALATGDASPVTDFFQPCSTIDLRPDNVAVEGLTDCNVILFTDTRTGANNCDMSPLTQSIDLQTRLPGLGLTGVIPEYVRCFCIDGTPTCALSVLQTTARVTDTVLARGHHHDFGTIPDVEFPCPHVAFWHPLVTEPPIIEGNDYINVGTGCTNPDTSRIRGTNQILTPSFDARPRDQILTSQLDNIRLALTSATAAAAHCPFSNVPGGLCDFITAATQNRLLQETDQCIGFADNSNWSQVARNLDDFIRIIEQNPSAFNNSARNVSGELEARALAALYQACELNTGNDPAVCRNRLP